MELTRVVDEAKEAIAADKDIMRHLRGYGLSIDSVPILVTNKTGKSLRYHQRGFTDLVMILCDNDPDDMKCDLWIPLRGNTVRLPK